jgi:hypothetical protein
MITKKLVEVMLLGLDATLVYMYYGCDYGYQQQQCCWQACGERGSAKLQHSSWIMVIKSHLFLVPHSTSFAG